MDKCEENMLSPAVSHLHSPYDEASGHSCPGDAAVIRSLSFLIYVLVAAAQTD